MCLLTPQHQPIDNLIALFLAFFGVFAFLATSLHNCQGKKKNTYQKKILPPLKCGKCNDKKKSGGHVVSFWSDIASVVCFGVFRRFPDAAIKCQKTDWQARGTFLLSFYKPLFLDARLLECACIRTVKRPRASTSPGLGSLRDAIILTPSCTFCALLKSRHKL
jgi:hypothetical protein